jgi:hypothetical protein
VEAEQGFWILEGLGFELIEEAFCFGGCALTVAAFGGFEIR